MPSTPRAGRSPVRRKLALLLVAVAVCGPLPARTEAATCPDPLRLAAAQALVPELLVWIAAHSDYEPGLTPLPDIAFCRAGERVPYEGAWIIADEALRGAYDVAARRIWLALPWDDADARAVSTLLHELVHHLQFTQRTWSCDAAAEWEAYRLQHLWLAERGIASGFDLPQIRLMSRCQTDVHP